MSGADILHGRCLKYGSVTDVYAYNGDARHHTPLKIQPSYTDAKIMIFFAIGGIFRPVFIAVFLNVGVC